MAAAPLEQEYVPVMSPGANPGPAAKVHHLDSQAVDGQLRAVVLVLGKEGVEELAHFGELPGGKAGREVLSCVFHGPRVHVQHPSGVPGAGGFRLLRVPGQPLRRPGPVPAVCRRRTAGRRALRGRAAVSQFAQVRAARDDPGRVDVLVHDVVVLLDLDEVDGVAEAGGLEQVPRVGPQHRHLAELLPVALEVPVVDGVEADQRGEQPHVGLGDGVAHEVPLAGEPLLQPVERGRRAGRRRRRTPPGSRRSRTGRRRC